MQEFPLPQFLTRALLALLLVLNGIAPALAAGAMHSTPSAHLATSPGPVMAMAAQGVDCHDGGGSLATPSEDALACCDDGACDLAGCQGACMGLAMALPVPAAGLHGVLATTESWCLRAHPHAAPPRGAVIRPPIA